MPSGHLYYLSILVNNAANANLCVNKLAFRQETADSASSPGVDLVLAFQEDLEALYVECFSLRYWVRGYQVRGITDPTYGFDVTGLAVQGIRTGEQLPPQVSAVLTLRTGLIGRSYRGRIYLPPANEGASIAGVWGPGYQGFCQDFGNTLALGVTNSVTGWGATCGVYSRLRDEFNPIQTVNVQATPGTQRRRRIGQGA